MIKILLENAYIQLLIVGLILVLVHFYLMRKRIKLNEPPIVHYRFPFIGHTWRFLTDCKNFIAESREQYGETFSIYVFGQIMTVTGNKNNIYDIFKRDHEFDFQEGSEIKIAKDTVFKYAAKDMDKCINILRKLFKLNLTHLTSRIQQYMINSIDIYIGDCVEPKVIHLNEVLLKTFSKIGANIIVGEECCHYEDILQIFRNLFYSVIKVFCSPKILSFIHPWFHEQAATSFLRSVSNHRKVIINRIRPIIEKRLLYKKKLGDTWCAPLDGIQLCLNDPAIAPNFDPDHVNYNFIVDTIAVFIFAAMSITSYLASYALYDLARRKEYWQELYQEAQEINNQCNGKLKSDDVDKMVKLDSFVKESLRLNSDILSMPRKCIAESYYTFPNGYQVPRGRMVLLATYEISMDEVLQGQSPAEFYTSRQISPATKLDRSSVVFGHGKHSCPGRFYAITLIKTLLHQVLLKYNVKTEYENSDPRTYVGFLIGPLKASKGGVIFENRC